MQAAYDCNELDVKFVQHHCQPLRFIWQEVLACGCRMILRLLVLKTSGAAMTVLSVSTADRKMITDKGTSKAYLHAFALQLGEHHCRIIPSR